MFGSMNVLTTRTRDCLLVNLVASCAACCRDPECINIILMMLYFACEVR